VLEDGEIIKRCLNGQTGMMDLLIDRYKTDLYSLCAKLARSGPDADDLFQDTWVKAMGSLRTYNPERRFKTWLFAICTNRYRDLYRWRKRWWRRVKGIGEGRGRAGDGPPAEARPADELAEMESGDPTPEERAVSRETEGALREGLEGLEDTLRLPILLFYYQDLSVAEIAGILDVPPGTIKTRLFRGRERLKTALEERGHGR
jgi:RNA polymerase sigma-70 factor (ECF subfamily)